MRRRTATRRQEADASTQVPDGGALDASVSSDGGACPVPLAPDLSVIANDEVLKFVAPGGLPIQIAVLACGRVDLHGGVSTRELAEPGGAVGTHAGAGPDRGDRMRPRRRSTRSTTSAPPTRRPRRTRPRPRSRTTTLGSSAWATGVASYLPGTGVSDPKWMMPSQAFGPAGTDTTAVVVLGNGGTITLTFAFSHHRRRQLGLRGLREQLRERRLPRARLRRGLERRESLRPLRFGVSERGDALRIVFGHRRGDRRSGRLLHGRVRNALRSGGAPKLSPGARRLRRSDGNQIRPDRRHRRRRDDARFLRPRDRRSASPAGRPPASISTGSPFSTSRCDDAPHG